MAGQEVKAPYEGTKSIKVFNRDPMPEHEYLMIGRVSQILDDIELLADAYGYSTTDREKVTDLIGRVLSGWSMELRLRRNRYIEQLECLKDADKQGIQSPNP